MPFAQQKIHPPLATIFTSQNHLSITILPYAWQNAKILFNSPPFLPSDFHCRFLIFHKSAQVLFLTSYNPDQIPITKTALRHLSVLYHLLIKQRPPRLLFFLSRKLFYLSGFLLLTSYWDELVKATVDVIALSIGLYSLN